MKLQFLKWFVISFLLSFSIGLNAQLELDFSHERGYYQNAFQLTITPSDPSATIKYTTNNSKPSFSNGTTYSGPLTISDITNLKVFAYIASGSTKVIAHSYIFINSAIAQGDSYIVASGTYSGLMQDSYEALPVISLSSDAISAGKSDVPTETEVSAEMFFPDQSRKGFMINCGIQTWGGSPTNPKKHYRLEFKAIYGDSKLRYDIFEPDNYDDTEYGVKPVAKFDKLLLRSGSQDGLNAEYGNENLAQYVRNRVQFDMQMDMGYPAPHGRFVHVFINGDYNGMYHLMERPDEEFFESYYGHEKEDYEVYKSGGYWNGPFDIFSVLPNYVDNLTTQAAIDNANTYLDLDQTAAFLTLMCYGSGFDWTTVHNCLGGGHVSPGVVPYKFLLWDVDFTFGNGGRWHPNYGGNPDFFIVPTTQDGQVPNQLDEQLEFKFMMADHMECECFNDGFLTPSAVDTRYMDRINQVRTALIAESSIWGNVPFSFGSNGTNHIAKSYWDVFDEFDKETNRLRNSHFPVRTANMVNYWKTNGVYPNTASVQFSQYGGIVNAGHVLTLTNPSGSGTIYYTLDGTDPRDVNGYIRSTATPYSGPITLPNGVITVKARVRNTNYGRTSINRWSAMCPRKFYVDQDYSAIVINEIMYHPDSLCAQNGNDSTEIDYIELHNSGSKTVNLQDCYFTSGVEFKFNGTAVIAPGGYMVLTENELEFFLAYFISPFGQYKGGLSNDGEHLSLVNPEKTVIDSLTYNDKNPWDEDPDGNGPSLELLNPTFDNADPLNWFRSDNHCGTPNAVNSRVCASNAIELVINEINYNSDNLNFDPGDWVELHNPNAIAVNLDNWQLFDNNNEFTFPAGTTIGPGEYLVLVENTAMFTASFPEVNNFIGEFPYAFSNKGERISLFNPDKCLSDYVVFNDRIPWDTMPDGNGPTLSLIDPALDNSLPGSWNSSDDITRPHGTPGRANVPCPAFNYTIPNTICLNVAAPISVTNNSGATIKWVFPNATPATSTNTTVAVTFNTVGQQTIQLLTFYYDCVDTTNIVIIVDQCNSPPNSQPDNYSIDEDNSLSGNVLNNDSELDGDAMVVSLNSNVSNGNLVFFNDGNFTYTPNLNYFGSDGFNYKVCDDATPALCVNENVTIVVNPVNDTPSSNNDAYTGVEDIVISKNVLINDSDVDGDNLTTTVAATTSNGTLVLQLNGSFTYTPTSNYFGSDAFTYKVCDDGVPSICVTESASIYLSPVDDPPITTPDFLTINEDNNGGNNVLTNDLEVEGQPMSVTLTTNVSNGTVTLNANGSYTYVPNPNYHGTDIFTYTACDNSNPALCTVETVTITVNSINDTPVTTNDQYSSNEDTSINGSVLSNDSDVDGDNLTTTVHTIPTNGTLVLQTNGTFNYTPNANYYGTDAFVYQVCDDGAPMICVTENVSITIVSVNDPPSTITDNLTIDEDDSGNGNVLNNDSDVENDPLTVSLVSNVNFGTLNLNANGTFSYIPNPNYFGSDGFSYKVCDTEPLCTTETVSINVTSVNDAPIAVDDSLLTDMEVQVAGDVSTNDSDVETAQLSYSLVSISYNGSILFNFDGSFYYTPFAGFYGVDTFSYQVCDNDTPNYCDTAIVVIDVVPDCIVMDISLFLEGPYDPVAGLLNTGLNTVRKLLPGMSSNSVAGQPYNLAPWNYSGTEGLNWTDADYDPTVVDWMLISFRTGLTKSSEVLQIAGILHSDGSMEFPETCVSIQELSSAYYIVAEHRNHMAAMTPAKVPVINRTISWDFRTANSYNASASGQKELTSGVWALYAGDCNQIDDVVSYDISGKDKSAWLIDNGRFGEYLNTDIDMNGDINGADKALWLLNNGVFGSVQK